MKLMETVLGQLLNRSSLMLTEHYFWRNAFNDPIFRKWILDLIRNEQLFKKGIDMDGDIIGYYSEFTEKINPLKKAGTHYTLKDTGEFYDSMIIYIYTNYIEIDADPLKENEQGETENLFYKYTEAIIGLTDDNMDKLAYELLRRYRNEINRVLSVNR